MFLVLDASGWNVRTVILEVLKKQLSLLSWSKGSETQTLLMGLWIPENGYPDPLNQENGFISCHEMYGAICTLLVSKGWITHARLWRLYDVRVQCENLSNNYYFYQSFHTAKPKTDHNFSHGTFSTGICHACEAHSWFNSRRKNIWNHLLYIIIYSP